MKTGFMYEITAGLATPGESIVPNGWLVVSCRSGSVKVPEWSVRRSLSEIKADKPGSPFFQAS